MAQARIVILSGALEGQAFEIAGPITIGRNPDNIICLDDKLVSRRHAVVEPTSNGVILRDLGSGNGTYVREQRIVESRLRNGDTIRIGSVDLRFEGGETAIGVRFEEKLSGRMEVSSPSDIYETFFQGARRALSDKEQKDARTRLETVYRANEIFASERDLRRLFERVMDQIFSLVPAHNGVILLKDERTGELITECVKSGSGETLVSSTIVGRALDNGEAIITYDAADDSRFNAGASIIAHNISSVMCTPLTHQNERLGVLYVDTRGTTNAFTRSDLELLVALAGPAAIAIRNAQYLHKLEQAYHDTLIVISNAIEMRDHYTVGHTWRVTNFALEISRTLGWSEEQLKACEMGSLLHDVGKIAVDDAILRKTAPLTNEEYAKMKVHPERGARMLLDVEFLKPMIPYCLYHHERYDGKGYPYGMAGENIPIEARVLAVADTFDAMTSNRPYRRGLDPEIAIDEIEKGKGTQFDPVVVDALVKCYREGRITRIIQESFKGEKSIVCPWCSTYIVIPDGANIGDRFECRVCHRHVRLCMQNEAYFGELLAESQ